MDSLSEDPGPVGIEKISGEERYRLRQRNYRIIYEISDGEVIVVVLKIGHQAEAVSAISAEFRGHGACHRSCVSRRQWRQ